MLVRVTPGTWRTRYGVSLLDGPEELPGAAIAAPPTLSARADATAPAAKRGVDLADIDDPFKGLRGVRSWPRR
jgi:hypothetical protein